MAEWRLTQVRLSAEARDALDRHCAEHGITLTALIEAFALGVRDRTIEARADVVNRARQIDRDRRSR